MKKGTRILSLLAVLVLSTAVLTTCSGGGGGTPGAVALYVTDDMSDDYQQVTATINKVQILNKGTGASCDVLTGPVTVNIAELSSVLQLIDITQCPAVDYNRIHIEFDRSVQLTNMAGMSSECSFGSYTDEGGRVKRLQCNGDVCTLDINGAVNVLVNQYNKLTLDFDLKEFEVEHFGEAGCTVTMKVSPLHSDDMKELDDREEVKGYISALDTDLKTLTLTTRYGIAFTVNYSGVEQPGIDTLLQRAQDDGLKVKVKAASIDLAAATITARAIYVKVEGMVSNLDMTNYRFMLTYQMIKTMQIDYTPAVNAEEVEGPLMNGMFVEVELVGFDGTHYLATEVEKEDYDDYDEKVTGYISGLDIDLKTFTLSRRKMTFTVDYSGVTQAGIDELLQRAQDDSMKVRVWSSSIDLAAGTITARAIYVKVEGMVSNPDMTNYHFTLTYQMNKTMPIDYKAAYDAGEVEGPLADMAYVEVELMGFDAMYYLAREVEVEDDDDHYETD